jgi:peptide/nickel transport system permease protein
VAEPVARPRGYWRLVAARFAGNRVAIGALAVVVVIVLIAFVGAPFAAALIGHGPNDLNFNAGGTAMTGHPAGVWTWVPGQPIYMPHRSLYVLGADGQTGRDLFLRLLYGGRTTLEIGLWATLLAVTVGVPLGLVAGYAGGRTGAVVVWLTDLVMVFPFLLLGIVIYTTSGSSLTGITIYGLFAPGVVLLGTVIGAFTWFYPMRLTRAHVLALRDREFIEAARMVGASNVRIMRTHLLPHLLAPIAAYAAIVLASAMIAEAGLSWLGLRLPPPTASWGGMLADAPAVLLTSGQFRINVPAGWTYLLPIVAVLTAVVALNLVAEGLRTALDPQASRR